MSEAEEAARQLLRKLLPEHPEVTADLCAFTSSSDPFPASLLSSACVDRMSPVVWWTSANCKSWADPGGRQGGQLPPPRALDLTPGCPPPSHQFNDLVVSHAHVRHPMTHPHGKNLNAFSTLTISE